MSDLKVALILRFVDQATRPARAAMAQVESMAGAGKRVAREQMEGQRANMAAETAAIVGAGWAMQRALQPAIAFEAKMAEVGKVVDFEALDGLQLLGRDIQKLATSGGLPMLADGIAEIVAAAGSGGFIDEALRDAEKRAELIAFAEAAGKMGSPSTSRPPRPAARWRCGGGRSASPGTKPLASAMRSITSRTRWACRPAI